MTKIDLVTRVIPEIHGSLSRLPEDILVGFLAHFDEVLEGLTEREVEEAAKSLAESEQIPKLHRVPYAIRDIAMSRRTAAHEAKWRAIADGHDTVRCQRCLDTGIVSVWHPQAVKELVQARREGRDPRFDGSGTYTVRCKCQAGAAYAWLRQYEPWMPVLCELWSNGRLVATASIHEPEQQALALKWWESRFGGSARRNQPSY